MDEPSAYDSPDAPLAYGPAEPPAYREAGPAYASGEPPPAYYGSHRETGEPRDDGDAGQADPYAAVEEPNASASTEPFRGPFEPPPGQPRPHEPAEAEPGGNPAPYERLAEAGPATSLSRGTPGSGGGYDDADGDSGYGSSEEKLEQIKDLYMTVEAIGDDNVDKHFDELLQRQRELISEYFKETGIGTGKTGVMRDGNAADAT
jgi:hypothetical protein